MTARPRAERWEGTLPRLLSGRMQKALQESLDKALRT
jgi:hypothetical protein